jgi:GNAT superfamily N-acetyltransferase
VSANVFQAEAPADLEQVRELVLEYVATLPGGHVDTPGLEQELAGLPGAYAPPRGRLLLARVGAAAAGCVALRPLGDDVAEVKRLYVRPAFRGLGLGRRLVEAVLDGARQGGHRRVRLDTLPSMTAALALYGAFGFRPAPAYLDRHAPGALCFELVLG